MSYTIEQISKIDAEMRQFQKLYDKTRIRIGLELAKRLKAFDDHSLYLKLDEQSYPNFHTYLQSLDIRYKSAREVMGLYEAYVIVAGMTIEELVDAEYHKLTTVKGMCFKYQGGQYQLTTSKEELKKWVSEAKSDITQDDLRQKVREEKAGEHEHVWKIMKYKWCTVCKVKEYIL